MVRALSQAGVGPPARAGSLLSACYTSVHLSSTYVFSVPSCFSFSRGNSKLDDRGSRDTVSDRKTRTVKIRPIKIKIKTSMLIFVVVSLHMLSDRNKQQPPKAFFTEQTQNGDSGLASQGTRQGP